MSIIGDGIMLGAGGETASIFVTGLSETDSVTATHKILKKVPNPASVVPDGYTQLEYIESAGTQYIDTGISVPHESSKVVVQFSTSNTTQDAPISGYAYSTWGWSTNMLYVSNKQKFGINGVVGPTVVAGTVYEVEYSNTYFKINGATTSATFTGYVDGYNNTVFYGNGKRGQYKLYFYKLYNGSLLVRDYVPAKRNSDGSVGLYDLVSNTFFGNSGTGTFTAGPEIPQTIDGFLISKIKDYGTWTVTATDGTNTATQDVLVDSAMQYDIELSYIPWLYRNGDPCENITGGWTNDDYTFTTWGSSYTRFQVTQTDEYMDSSATSGYTLAGTFNAIDLTNYSKVMWEIDNVTGIAGGGYPPTWRLCASPAKSFSTSTETVTEVQVTETGTHTYSIDVSSLSGLFFISFTNNSIAYSGRQLVGHILRVWLE